MGQEIIDGIHRANQRKRIPAIVGRAAAGGGWAYTVAGWPEMIWVTLRGSASGNSPAYAKDLIGLVSGTDDGLPIWVEPQPDGMLAITERRTEQAQ